MIVLPLMAEVNHVLFAASSPKVGGGGYTNVILAKDTDGTPLMNSLIIGDPCDACKRSTTPWMCPHKMNELATWKDPHMLTLLAKLYKACDMEDVMMSELYTMTKSSDSSIFRRQLYERFVTEEPKKFNDKIDVVYISIDPAGGGSSEFALTAMGYSMNGPCRFQVHVLCIIRLYTYIYIINMNSKNNAMQNKIQNTHNTKALSRQCSIDPRISIHSFLLSDVFEQHLCCAVLYRYRHLE